MVKLATALYTVEAPTALIWKKYSVPGARPLSAPASAVFEVPVAFAGLAAAVVAPEQLVKVVVL